MLYLILLIVGVVGGIALWKHRQTIKAAAEAEAAKLAQSAQTAAETEIKKL